MQKIRSATSADAAMLAELERHAFASERISQRSFRRLATAASATTLVAEADGKILGYAMLLFRCNTGIGRLYSIAVAPQMSGRGIGRQLLARSEAATLAAGRSRLRLEVSRNNLAAIRLYSDSGYRQFGVHRNYYADGSDALRFEKQLGKADEPACPNHRSA